ncbi:hypothetical protein pEaSNUABM50_00347 [Erwinia phage pEa_SNUABM_50]|uniref:Uncharacterized protein n=3 Tax=Eneladusvirus BF TaxID=2560751 RepID=A0A7L8ZNR1_9CAUD|nr:hypothetical protein FDH34_gp351 [Serratia phage BF]AQW88876.1 hypothetical protein BF_0351 [Serratia phage BF]QOI71832.1 hypothetical protein pEaSNUABM47_00348 [Erwinia phage pEa_SNUABM_47]QOI72371.1 hypothetical protein pEaSNUABM50_00347 [Erwinia phage pEa_SNUABM_50]QXO12598.1 hypothetical protein pEaSNUABM49_00352 [Erwinia phage pEa_SNUABM_49]
MFNDEELKAFYAGKEQGYKANEYKNPHLEFVNGLGGAAAIAEDKLHQQFKRGYSWGQAQKNEEDSK